MKKIFIAILSLIVCLTSTAETSAFEIQLQGWQLTNEYVVPLLSGRVIYKTYEREFPRGSIEIILTEGSDTGRLYVPELVKNSKGLMPAAEYKIFELNGYRAVLENQPYLPSALAVQVSDNVVLTLESHSLNQNEIINVADEILAGLVSRLKIN